jgi:hypothetical protein
MVLYVDTTTVNCEKMTAASPHGMVIVLQCSSCIVSEPEESKWIYIYALLSCIQNFNSLHKAQDMTFNSINFVTGLSTTSGNHKALWHFHMHFLEKLCHDQFFGTDSTALYLHDFESYVAHSFHLAKHPGCYSQLITFKSGYQCAGGRMMNTSGPQ